MPRSRGGGRGKGHGWSKRSSRSKSRKPNPRGTSKATKNHSTAESSHSQANSKDALEEVGVELVNGDDEFEAWMDQQGQDEVDPISTNHHFEVEQAYPIGPVLSTGKEFEQVYQGNCAEELAGVETIVFINSPAEAAEEEDPLAHNDPLGQSPSVVGLTMRVGAEEEELNNVDDELANLRIPSTVEITPVADLPTEIIVLPDEPEIVELSSSESNSPGKADVLHVYDEVDNLIIEEQNRPRIRPKHVEEAEPSKTPSNITYTIAPSLLSVAERRLQLQLMESSEGNHSFGAQSKPRKGRTHFTSHETDIEMVDPEEPHIKDLNVLTAIVNPLPSSNPLQIIQTKVKKNLRTRRNGSLNLNYDTSVNDSYAVNGEFDDNSRDFQPSPNDEEEEEWKITRRNKTEKNKKKPVGRKGQKFKRKSADESEKSRQQIKRRRSGRSQRKSSRAKQRSSSTETSSEAEEKYCEVDSPVEKVSGSKDSDKSDNYDPVGDDGGGDKKTNGIETSRRTSRYRTRQHRTMIAEVKFTESKKKSNRKDSVDSGISKESSGNGCGDDEDEILIVADSVPKTPAVHKGKTPRKKAQGTSNNNSNHHHSLTNGNQLPDLGPPVLEKAVPSTDTDKANEEECEKMPKEDVIISDNNKGDSSAENSYEMLMLPSDEELPDIDDIPMPPPPVFNPDASSSQPQLTEPPPSSSSSPPSLSSQSQLVQPELNNGDIVPTILTPSDNIEMDSESKRVSTPPMVAASSEAQSVAVILVAPEDILDKVTDSLEKNVTPAGVKKPYYNNEQRNHLYRDGAMLAEREDLSTFGSINLWRMRLKEKLLQKFLPGVIDRKDCHYSVNIFVKLPLLDEDFYAKYQPVIFDFLVDNKEEAVGKYYNIHGCIPVMGYLGATDHLYDDFRMFLKFMTLRALTDHKKLSDEIELRENIGEVAVRAVENIENHLASTIEGIMFRDQWPKDVMYCILEYPKMKLTRMGLKKDAVCEPCRRLGKEGKAAYKMILHGPLYDPDTLGLLEKRGGTYTDFHYCYVCPVSLRALHRLIHYKYWVFMSIRMELKLFYEKGEAGHRYDTQEIFNHITGDYDWTKKMFYEFQTTTAEGLFAKDRSDKAEKNAVKRKLEASAVKRPPGRPKSASSSINKARRRPKLISSSRSKIPFVTHQYNSQDLATVPNIFSTVSNVFPTVSQVSPTQNASPAFSNSSPTFSNVSPAFSYASPSVSNVSSNIFPTLTEVSPIRSNISSTVSNGSETVSNISRSFSPAMRQCDTSLVTPVDMEREPEMPQIDLCSYATPMVTTGPTDELPDEPPQVTQVMDVVP